jgi:hypothetical protein
MTEDDYREYGPHERPKVEVLVEGVWYPGRLRAWSRPSNGGPWWGNVIYRSAPGKRHVATVHQSRIREPPPPAETSPPDAGST